MGTKYDLKEDPGTLAEMEKLDSKPVTLEEGKEMAKSINAFCYKECSAKTGYQVNDVFDEAIKASFLKQSSSEGLFSCCKTM